MLRRDIQAIANRIRIHELTIEKSFNASANGVPDAGSESPAGRNVLWSRTVCRCRPSFAMRRKLLQEFSRNQLKQYELCSLAVPVDSRAHSKMHSITQDSTLAQTAQLSVEEVPTLDPAVFKEFREMLGIASTELLQEMIDCYLEEAPKLLQTMQDALVQANIVALRRAAHTLKSSSAVLGAMALAKLCQNLESETSSAIAADTTAPIAQIEAEYKKVQSALQKIKES